MVIVASYARARVLRAGEGGGEGVRERGRERDVYLYISYI